MDRTFIEEKGRTAQIRSVVESVREKYIIQAAEDLIGQVGLESEDWWNKPLSRAYIRLNDSDKVTALKAAAVLYDREADKSHEKYQNAFVESLHKGGDNSNAIVGVIDKFTDFDQKSMLNKLTSSAGMTTVALAALSNAPTLVAAATTLPPICAAGVAASFAWMMYSRYHAEGSHAWVTTVAPVVIMGLCCPAAAALSVTSGFATGMFNFDGNEFYKGKKVYPDAILSGVATLALLNLTGLTAPVIMYTAASAACLEASSAYKSISTNNYTKGELHANPLYSI